jgi:hypothetical protein
MRSRDDKAIVRADYLPVIVTSWLGSLSRLSLSTAVTTYVLLLPLANPASVKLFVFTVLILSRP